MKLRVTGAALILPMLFMAAGPAFAEASVPAPASAPPSASVAPVSSLVPADFNVPTLVETADFKIVPLGPELAKVDFEAYMSSIEHLQQTFTRSTGWPHKDISDADAMADMEAEQARFANRTSFAYAVLAPDGSRELGCVYVYPSTVDGYDAMVRMWVTKAEYDAGFDAELYQWVTNWIATDWPFEKVAYPGRAIDWATWDTMVAANKAK
ncbi:MAG: twin-arginine translocation pathway signal protein [Proteobacteria bacterium]|nr:MAG: twin-arginine translocation pathway signal protein [Pseudomonadota bacterium]